ncbi:MAG: GH3 auxin-responsive promoter family protein, partial [Planctomycetaceae bacterium]|nr:GH3 auxin-responsive promoter family protein [Planctomycetaceae bacterium]
NISGLVAAMQKRVVRSMYTIPAAVSEITDADAKRYTILRLALADPWVGMLITANPSTLLQLTEFANLEAEHLIRDIHNGGISDVDLPATISSAFRRRLRPDARRAGQLQQIMERHGNLQPRRCWPLLQALGVWCGGSAAAYIPKLKQVFEGITIRDHGLHASEGRMTLPLEDESRAGLLEIQTHFFEFMPVTEAESDRPEVLEAHELQEGAEYFILLTTSSGLYRYNIRDVVRCTGFYGTTPFLEFRHKGAHISSITGEKLAESQVVEAVNAAAQASGMKLKLFTLTPQWGQPPGYVLFLWCDHDDHESSGTDLSRFAGMVDEQLAAANEEYRDKRQSGRIGPVCARKLSPDLWNSFTQSRQDRSGGSPEQYKHPCLLPDPEFRGLIGEREARSGEQEVMAKRPEFNQFD